MEQLGRDIKYKNIMEALGTLEYYGIIGVKEAVKESKLNEFFALVFTKEDSCNRVTPAWGQSSKANLNRHSRVEVLLCL